MYFLFYIIYLVMLSVLILYVRVQRFTKSQNLVPVYVAGGSVLPFCLLQYLENHTCVGSLL